MWGIMILWRWSLDVTYLYLTKAPYLMFRHFRHYINHKYTEFQKGTVRKQTFVFLNEYGNNGHSFYQTFGFSSRSLHGVRIKLEKRRREVVKYVHVNLMKSPNCYKYSPFSVIDTDGFLIQKASINVRHKKYASSNNLHLCSYHWLLGLN